MVPVTPATGNRTVTALPNEVNAVIALGSNLGYRRKTLLSALSCFTVHPDVTVYKISPMVLSAPVGTSHDGTCVDVRNQPPYLNMVVEVGTTLSAEKLLETAQKIENRHDRRRERRWSCRTLDIDLITYDDRNADTGKLVLPHPRAWERAFVLYPWSLMDPTATFAHQLVRDLATQASDRNSLRLLPADFSDNFIETPRTTSSSRNGNGGNDGR